MDNSCTTCARFLQCPTPENRGPRYVCGQYIGIQGQTLSPSPTPDKSENPYSKMLAVLRGETSKPVPRQTWSDSISDGIDAHFGHVSDLDIDSIEEDDNEELDLQHIIGEAMSPQRVVPPDLKVDDRDLPEAPNFFTWCTGPRFLKYPPYAKQLIIATHLFAEWCPKCSNPIAGSIQDFPKDFPISSAPDVIQFLEHGVCPKCKTDKATFIANGDLNNYQETALAIGQRCVVGETIVLTAKGIVEIGDYAEGRPYGFSGMTLHVATLDENAKNSTGVTDAFYQCHPDLTLKVTLWGAHTIVGTKDHPILTDQGFRTLGSLSGGEWVRVQYNQQLFGHHVENLEDVGARATRRWREDAQDPDIAIVPLQVPREMTPHIARILGFAVGFGPDILWKDVTNRLHRQIRVASGPKVSAVCGHFLKTFQDANHPDDARIWMQHWIAILLDVSRETICHWTPADAAIPSCIRQAPREIIAAFIRAVFEITGFVNPQGRLGFSSPSDRLIRQIYAILLNMGIPAGIRPILPERDRSVEWQVVIGARALTLYEERIGFFSLQWREFVHQHRLKNSSDFCDVLPDSWRSLYRHLVAETRQAILNAIEQESCGEISTDEPCSLRSIVNIFQTEDDSKTLYRQSVADKYKIVQDYLHPHCNATLIQQWEQFHQQCQGDFWYEQVSHIQKMPVVETYDIRVPGDHSFITNGIVSHNSGKSILLSLFQSYLLHRFLKLQNPAKVYNQASNTFFSATMVGITFARAKSLVYNPLRLAIDNSPWFQEYHKLLDDRSEKYGEDLYSVGRAMISYRHRNLVLYPASPSKRTLRGDTRAWHVVDELGWFPFGEDSSRLERAGADEVYEALDRSLLTLRVAQEKLVRRGFSNIPNAYGLMASSPQAKNDKIMTLMRTFAGTRYGLSVHLASWEMSPDLERTSQSIEKEFRVNPIKAERDYGANPPLSEDAFIPKPETYRHCFSKKLNILGQYKYRSVERSSKRRYAKFLALSSQMQPSILALDAGHNNNSFGLALGRVGKKGIPQIYGIMEISPESEHDLDFSEIFEQCIIPIIDKSNVAKVIVDRWQSIKIIHDVERYGQKLRDEITGEQYSMRREDFNLVIDWMNDPDKHPQFPTLETSWNRVLTSVINNEEYPRCFRYRPVSHFLFQMATVSTSPKGVVKGVGYTDDLFRAVFLLLLYLYDEEEQMALAQRMLAVRSRGPTGIVSASGFSGGGSRASSSSEKSRIVAVGSFSGGKGGGGQAGGGGSGRSAASVGRSGSR